MPLALFVVQYLGNPRDHHALCIRLKGKDDPGILFHVIGDIERGMTYEKKDTKPPWQSASYVGMSLVGWMSSSDLPRVDSICRSNPPRAVT